jgi:N-acyl-D-amino-acid deacylase
MGIMKDALIESLEAGAAGLSTGLIYVPACYSDQEELEEFCHILAHYNRVFAIHMRNESDMFFESVEESIELARKTGVHLHISHLKSSGKTNWYQVDPVLELIDSNRAQGLNITCDQYPYIAGSTTINVLFPQWVVEGGIMAMLERLKNREIRERIKEDFKDGIPGWDSLVRCNGWDNIVLNFIGNEAYKGFEESTMEEVAESMGKEPAEALFDLVIAIQGEASIVVYQQSEENVVKAMRKEYVAIGSDGLHSGVKPHPRLYGTFPRVLSRYVRELKTIPLAEAIRKMTSLPADLIGQPLLGRVQEGCSADLAIFVPELIEETASFANPAQHPTGIRAVIVSGVPVVVNGEHTLARPGRMVLCQ